LSVPEVVVERVMKAVERFVVEAVRNDEYIVDEEYPNVWRAVHVFGLVRLRPIVRAVAPVYVPENERVESVAERLASVPPRAMPEMVEFVREALGMFEVTSAPPERASPVPVRSLKDSPFTMRFVVEAVVKEP
jgi:hypothetical protein